VHDVAVSFIQAAKRSWQDAQTLSPSSFGTADHLYGLAAECALKTILVGLQLMPASGPTSKSPLKSHIDRIWTEYNAHISGLAGRAALLLDFVNPFGKWQVGDRYEEDLTFTVTRLDEHRHGALMAMTMLEKARYEGLVP
jgi:hypothetical protein